jgi:hypothetical protein
MTDIEIRETIRQMIKDWNAATPEQRAAALATSNRLAEGIRVNG